jgi:hypothetical protein
MMLAPGLSDAWVMRTSTSLDDFRVGVVRLGVSDRTLEGVPAAVCVQARIVGDMVEVILGLRMEYSADYLEVHVDLMWPDMLSRDISE